MSFTDAQLNQKTKADLAALASDLQIQLASAQSGPLKSSDIEKKLLDLKRQADVVADNAKKRDQDHQIELTKIANAHELAIKKLELEYDSEEGLDAASLSKLYDDLAAKAAKSMDDLSFGLKQAEIETQVKIDALNEKLEAVKATYEEQSTALDEKLEAAKGKVAAEIATIQLNHTRTIEETQYKNKIALRDENLKAASDIAATQDKVLVDKSELADLKDFKAADEKAVQVLIAAEVKKAQSDVYAQEGGKLSKLKSESDTSIALLTKDKEYLTNSLADANTRIAELTAQIKDFPAQIAKAVEAAKANISVNQDAQKK